METALLWSPRYNGVAVYFLFSDTIHLSFKIEIFQIDTLFITFGEMFVSNDIRPRFLAMTFLVILPLPCLIMCLAC